MVPSSKLLSAHPNPIPSSSPWQRSLLALLSAEVAEHGSAWQWGELQEGERCKDLGREVGAHLPVQAGTEQKHPTLPLQAEEQEPEEFSAWLFISTVSARGRAWPGMDY